MTIEVDYKEVEKLAGRGLTRAQIALCLDMGTSTIYTKQQNDQEFKAALDRGHAKACAAITGKLLKHIDNGSLSAVIFFLKCQAGWKETQVNEHVGKDGEPLNLGGKTELTDAKLEQIAASGDDNAG